MVPTRAEALLGAMCRVQVASHVGCLSELVCREAGFSLSKNKAPRSRWLDPRIRLYPGDEKEQAG